MDNDKDKLDKDKDLILTDEEKQFDQEGMSEIKEDELRSKIAEDLGVDPKDEPELLDKLVARERSHREKLSSAIKQKRSWRDRATTKDSSKPKDQSDQGTGKSQTDTETLTEQRLNELLDEREAKRELERLDLPDDIQTEVRDIAKLRKISVRDALKLSYIQTRIKEVETEKRVQSASPKRSGGKGTYTSSYDASRPLDPSDFDLDSEEGRKEWKEAKEARRKYLATQE